jgi:hypothetical protein
MEDSKWERWSALGGILFVILILVSAFIPGSPPKTSDSTAKIAKFIADKPDEVRWAGYIGAIATFGLFWFLGAVWRILRRAEGGNPRLTVVAVAGALFATVMGALGGIVLGVLGIVGVTGSGGQAGTRFFYILATNLGVATVFGIAVFLTAFSVVILRTGVFPTLLGWFGLLIAVVAVPAGAVVASTRDVFFVLSFVAFIGFAVWMLIISVMILRGAGAEAPAPSPAPSAS